MRLEAPKDLNSSFVSPVILQPFTSVPMNENATHAPDNITIPRFMNSDYSEAHSVTSEMSHLAYTDPLLGEMSIIENMNEDAFIDPLPIEMERIEKEKEEAFKIHEQKVRATIHFFLSPPFDYYHIWILIPSTFSLLFVSLSNRYCSSNLTMKRRLKSKCKVQDVASKC